MQPARNREGIQEPLNAEGSREIVIYRMVGYRLLIFTTFGVTACVGVLLVRSLSANTEPQLAVFIAFWLMALVWNAYWAFFRIAREVAVVNHSTLRWRTIAMSYEAPLASVKEISTPFRPFGTGFRRIKLDGQRSPLLMNLAGVGEIIAMISSLRPEVAIKTGRLDRPYERFAISNVRWRRLGGGGGST